MSRITAINLLLLIAAVVLALALFIAGAVWRGRVMKEGPHSHWRPRIMQIS